MRNLSRGVLAVAFVAATFITGGTATAYAQDGDNCDPGEFCLFENHNFNNGDFDTYGKRQWEQSDQDYGNDRWWDYEVPSHDRTDVLDDEASSVKNRTGCDVRLWRNPGFGGNGTGFPPGLELDELNDEVVGDNEASSHQFVC